MNVDKARKDLSTGWRFLGLAGFTDTVFNHISVNITMADSISYLVNPWNRFAMDCRPQDFVLCKNSRTVSELDTERVNQSALILHGILQSTRSQGSAIVHLHSPGAMTLAATQDQLLPLNQISMEFVNDIAYVPYMGVFDTEFEANRIADEIEGRKLALLSHHGLVTIGDSITEAVYLAYYFEVACQLQARIVCAGKPLTHPPIEICNKSALQLREGRAQLLPAFWAGVEARVRATSYTSNSDS